MVILALIDSKLSSHRSNVTIKTRLFLRSFCVRRTSSEYYHVRTDLSRSFGFIYITALLKSKTKKRPLKYQLNQNVANSISEVEREFLTPISFFKSLEPGHRNPSIKTRLTCLWLFLQFVRLTRGESFV